MNGRDHTFDVMFNGYNCFSLFFFFKFEIAFYRMIKEMHFTIQNGDRTRHTKYLGVEQDDINSIKHTHINSCKTCHY